MLPDPKHIQLVILPGLGGDHRMAHSQLTLPFDCITPDYIPFEKGEKLEHYTRRFCDHLITNHKLDLTRPHFIAGYSLGSAVGMEIARLVPVTGLILIGGPMASHEIKFIPWIFGKYFCWWLPLWVYRAAEIFVAPVMRIVSGISEHEIRLAGVMYHELARGLFREGYRSLVAWHGCPIDVPYIRVHGEKDQIIACPKKDKHVFLVRKSKHLVGQARPKEVNDLIVRFVEQVIAGKA